MKRSRITIFGILAASILIIIAVLALVGAAYESQQESTPPCVAVLAPVPIPDDLSQITFSDVLEERCPATWEEFVEFSSGGTLDVASDIGEEEALRVLYDYNDQLMLEFNAAQ